METRQNRRLLVEYDVGAYGPTIRIYAHNRHLLSHFISLLTKLADGDAKQVQLLNSPLMLLEGLQGLKLEVAATGFYPTITSATPQGELPSFMWRCDAEGWQTCRETAQRLLDSFRAAHTYLTPESDSEIRVELSYAE